ncbi:MAG: lysophospholipid acyltransferase family protein [bacterium]|nr:lysophospholipid acyltransferase family protein [bacterium]
MKLYPIVRFLAGRAVKNHTATIDGLHHVPRDQACVFAANHIDFLDGIYMLLPATDRARRKIWFISVRKAYYWLVGGTTIAINRDAKSQVIDIAVKKLKAGESVCIFPEGRRNTSSKLLPGKTGAARIALQSRCPVIPVGVRGPSSGTFHESLKLLFLNQGQVRITFGRPMQFPDAYGRAIDDTLLRQVTDGIMREIGQLSGKTFISSTHTHANSME